MILSITAVGIALALALNEASPGALPGCVKVQAEAQPEDSDTSGVGEAVFKCTSGAQAAAENMAH